MLELNKDNFREIVGTDRIVLVSCWAPQCRVCTQFDPVFEQAAADHPQHVLARMNIMTDDDLGTFFEIEHTPTLMLYRDGLLLLKKPGTFTAEELGDILRQAESLDMDRVRSDLDNETSGSDQ